MRDHDYSLEDYQHLEETLLNVMSGVERVLEFDILDDKQENGFKEMHQYAGECYDEVHTKIMQITAKNKFKNVVAQAKSSYMELEDIIEIVKRYYSDDKLMA